MIQESSKIGHSIFQLLSFMTQVKGDSKLRDFQLMMKESFALKEKLHNNAEHFILIYHPT